MFLKLAVFLAIGCTLVLAENPVQQNVTEIKNRNLFDTFAKWLLKAEKALANVFDRVKQPFIKLYNRLVKTGEVVIDYSKEKLYQALNKYYDIKQKSSENLNKIKNAILVKIIDRLQKTIDTLNNHTGDETYEELKQKTKDIAESSKESLNKLQQQLQEAIDAEKKKLEQSLIQWEQEANEAMKK